MARNSNVPRSRENYSTPVSDEIEGRVTNKLFQEFSQTENPILGTLSSLDDVLRNPLIQDHSGDASETSLNAYGTSQRTNEDDSQSDPHPEASTSRSQTTQISRQEEAHDMVTGVHKEVTYCPPQQKNRSTSQPHFRIENIPATIEVDQSLLALKLLANNNNSANFRNKIIRISKWPKSFTTAMPKFDGKPERFEVFNDFFQTSFKIHNQLTGDDRIKYFPYLMRDDALQTFKNINGPTRENLEQILSVFRRKYEKTTIDGNSETHIPTQKKLSSIQQIKS